MKCISLALTAFQSFLVCNYFIFSNLLSVNDLTYYVDGLGMLEEDNANLKETYNYAAEKGLHFSL